MRLKLEAIVAGLFFLLFEIPAAFASGVDAIDKVIVTARGVESTVSQTPGGTGVLESRELFQARDPSVTDTLRKIPGVEKSSDSAWGSAINIRGLGRNRVVFLIDGCRVNTATDVNAQFGFVNPDDIERIEVLKGPISSLYGSGSMGGVVNVITKKGSFTSDAGFKTHVGTGFGSEPDGYSVFGDTSFNSPDYWVYGFGSKRDFGSYEDGGGKNIDNSQFEDYGLSLKSGYRWNAENTTEINVQYVEGNDIGIPGKGLALPAGPEIAYPETDRTLVSLTHALAKEKGVLSESKLNLFFQEIDRNVSMEFPPGGPMKSVLPSALHTTWGAKWQNVLDFRSHGVVTGLDAWSWEIESSRVKNLSSGLTGVDTPLADARQVSAGFFIEDDIVLSSAFRLNLGGRLDYIDTKSDALYTWVKPPAPAVKPVKKRDSESTDDASWDAHAGLTWNLPAPWSMTLLGAASYRAPDLMELYKYIAFVGGETYGNPDLDPERSYFMEWGVHYRQKAFRLSGAAYANFLRDMITEEPMGNGIYRMENVDEAEIFGGELEAEWRPDEIWSLYATAAYTRGRNKTDDRDLAFIPPWNGVFGVAYNSAGAGFWGDLNLEWADNQDEIAPGETPTPGWEAVNANAGYRFGLGKTMHDIVLGIDNLLDKQYANHLSTSRGVVLAEPGLNAYAAWKMEF